MSKQKHEHYLKIALKEAKKAFAQGHCPVGAVLVDNNKGEIMSKDFSQNHLSLLLSHAEINVIDTIKGSLRQRGDDLIIYTTLEPCIMCIGTLVRLGIVRFVFGQRDWNMWKRPPLDVSPYLRRKIKIYENINCFSNEYYELYCKYDKEEADRVFNVTA